MVLKRSSILVVDDDADILTAVRLLLRPEVKNVTTERNPKQLRSLLQEQDFDLVLLDMNFIAPVNTGNEGLFWLRQIREIKPSIAVIMITAYGDIDLAIRSIKEGAFDFIVKPWHNEKLLATIAAALQPERRPGRRPGLKIDAANGRKTMIGESEAIQDVLFKITKIAPTDASVLILGENGVGKDLIATAIHEQSLRKEKPFIKVDLGALTDSLFESELFGHKKGAFTDAREDRMGRFEAANGGTLFLDEIGNISLQQQTKLLTALQNRQITRLGSNQPVDIDIRLICATNLPLNELANEQRFRKDLIYRINTIDIIVPPLRERKEDIVLLAKHFTDVYSDKYSKPAIRLSEAAFEKLARHGFPGNVRELQHMIERAVIMAESDRIEAKDLLFSSLEIPVPEITGEDDLKLSVIEKSAILKVIEKHDGNITKAARELGLTRTALYRRLNKYDI